MISSPTLFTPCEPQVVYPKGDSPSSRKNPVLPKQATNAYDVARGMLLYYTDESGQQQLFTPMTTPTGTINSAFGISSTPTAVQSFDLATREAPQLASLDSQNPFEAVNKKKVKTVSCRHWMKGHCWLEDKCNFKHDPADLGISVKPAKKAPDVDASSKHLVQNLYLPGTLDRPVPEEGIREHRRSTVFTAFGGYFD